MTKLGAYKVTCIVMLCLLGAGCGGGREHEDLHIFMEDAKSQPRGQIEPLPTFKLYESFKYSTLAFRSPFEKPLTIAADDTSGKSAVKPDENRKKEYLEAFNFATFTLVGTLRRGGLLWPLINDGAGGVHRVALGNFLGKNHGKIVSVSPTKLVVVEIVPDGEGGWVERPRALALREKN